MSQHHWSIADIPDQHGKLAVVTGGNSGIGYEAARALAAKGAHVILAVRDTAKGRQALERIRRATPRAQVEVAALDLADLASVRQFAETLLAQQPALPLLINNAGVMALPYRRTADGNTPPLRTIRSAPAGKLALSIGNPGAAEYDTRRDEILVPN